MQKNTIQEAITLLEDDRARMLHRAAGELPGPLRAEAFARIARIDAMLYRLRRVPGWQRPGPSGHSAAA
jgi:hypothetical protein